jgi:hypothetical protein
VKVGEKVAGLDAKEAKRGVGAGWEQGFKAGVRMDAGAEEGRERHRNAL